MKKKIYHGRIFYGWYIVAAAFIIMAVGWGIVFNTASLFINPISEELGLSRKAINATFTIRSICQLVISLFSGLIYKKLKMKNLMTVTSLSLALSFFFTCFCKKYRYAILSNYYSQLFHGPLRNPTPFHNIKQLVPGGNWLCHWTSLYGQWVGRHDT